MGIVMFYMLLILLAGAVISFVFGNYTIGYVIGSIFGSVAWGAGYVYSSRDDNRYRSNYLNNRQ
ncbi:hypothetical protein [Neobacillus dielmonensis]|uniref:hypothetical protein n=1 Tax=Neobacillus dielmonensis TaxID=1347369 RepID=UPI0012B5E9F0|nr:hypothetical protein [Neobacillus dielmonensis]